MIQKINIHGYFSMALFIVALGIANYTLFQKSIWLGSTYTLIVIVGFTLVSLVYCVKCSIRENCNHLFLGQISRLRKFNNTNYTKLDLIITFATIAAIVAFPQFWLYQQLSILFAFWGLIAVAGIEILIFVCAKCGNKKCAMCKDESKN